MTWWGWMVLGAVLLGAELFAVDAQFYMVFLGVSAALVGLVGLTGIVMPEWTQWMVFAGLSLVFFATFRRVLYEKIRAGAKGYEHTIAGDTVVVKDSLPAGSDTRTEYRGSTWTIVNVGETPVAAGARARVVEVDGLSLKVVAE